MKKSIVLLICFTCYFLSTNAQIASHIKVDIGSSLNLSTRSAGQSYSSSTRDGLFHIGAGYQFNFGDSFYLGAGPRLDYFSGILFPKKDAYMASVLLQGQVNFKPQPKTFYLYGNLGLSPKFGSRFYAGRIAEFGVGWQYQPKFISGKTLSFALGYNNTRLNNIYAENYTSSDGVNIKKTTGYYKYTLSSFAINIGVSF